MAGSDRTQGPNGRGGHTVTAYTTALTRTEYYAARSWYGTPETRFPRPPHVHWPYTAIQYERRGGLMYQDQETEQSFYDPPPHYYDEYNRECALCGGQAEEQYRYFDSELCAVCGEYHHEQNQADTERARRKEAER